MAIGGCFDVSFPMECGRLHLDVMHAASGSREVEHRSPRSQGDTGQDIVAVVIHGQVKSLCH